MAIGLSSISNIIPQAATENLREIDILSGFGEKTF
jgi:hypothetical protein